MYRINIRRSIPSRPSGSVSPAVLADDSSIIDVYKRQGWDNSTPMTLNAETGEWSITTELAAGNYKFRANNKWDINLGGDLNHLTYGGDNITTEAGTYVITLKLGDASNYHATVVKR